MISVGTHARLGSPPRVRGKEIGTWQNEISGRITPACAGKSFCLSGSDTFGRDHPRVCGEKTKESLKK